MPKTKKNNSKTHEKPISIPLEFEDAVKQIVSISIPNKNKKTKTMGSDIKNES